MIDYLFKNNYDELINKRNQAKHKMEKVTTRTIKALFVRTLSLRLKTNFQRLDTFTIFKTLGSK